MASESDVGGSLGAWNFNFLVHCALFRFVLIRLYLIGIAMGIADLVPGVSGGTIALISGIYEELLESIKTLQLHSLKKIAWPFLLPLGMGICTAIFLASRLFYYLLFSHPVPLFSFLFGVILASAFSCGRKAGLQKASHWIPLVIGAFIAFFIAGLPQNHLFGFSFIGLSAAGMAAASAMLLPGISGSYLLHLFGIYPLALAALTTPTAPDSFRLLAALGLGVSLGFICFSRLVSWLVSRLSTWTYAVLVGFMLGGTRSIWPFPEGGWFAPLFSSIGFLLVILLEMRVKKKSLIRRV